MDDCRFDNWTRMLGKLQDRRVALKELAGAGTALFSLLKLDLGLVQAQEVGIAGCGIPGESCSKDGDCCSDKCSNSTKRVCDKKKSSKGKGKKKGHSKPKKKCRNENVAGVCGCIDRNKNGCDGRDGACCNGRCAGDTCVCVEPKSFCRTDKDCCDDKPCTNNLCAG
jgi:hypothetical protein